MLVAFDTMHKLKGQKKRKNTLTTLKFDMNKVYDKVQWNFLKAVMLKIIEGGSFCLIKSLIQF